MIYHPENIWNFGKNKGYSLAEIYHYLPTYIEHLIEYNQDFEIDVDEFLALPKPLEFYSILDFRLNNKHLKAKEIKSHFGSVEEMMKTNAEKLKEIDYKFPEKYLQILRSKRRNEYRAPKYESSKSSDISSLEELRNRYKK